MEDNSVNKMTFTVLNPRDIEMYETGSSDQKKLAVLKENVRLWDVIEHFRRALDFYGSWYRD